MATLFTKVITNSFYKNLIMYFCKQEIHCYFKFNMFLFYCLNYFFIHKTIQKKIATFAPKIIRALNSSNKMRV